MNVLLATLCAFVVAVSSAGPTRAEPGLATPSRQIAAAQDGRWTVMRLVGNAVRLRDGQTLGPLRESDLLKRMDVVETSAGSEVVIGRSGDIVRILENTRLRVGEASGQSPLRTLYQWFGSIFLDVRTDPGSPFSVDTPYLTALVKGTQFTVSVNDGAVVHVVEGLVEVSLNGEDETALLGAGETAVFDEDESGALQIFDGSSPAPQIAPDEEEAPSTDTPEATSGDDEAVLDLDPGLGEAAGANGLIEEIEDDADALEDVGVDAARDEDGDGDGDGDDPMSIPGSAPTDDDSEEDGGEAESDERRDDGDDGDDEEGNEDDADDDGDDDRDDDTDDDRDDDDEEDDDGGDDDD